MKKPLILSIAILGITFSLSAQIPTDGLVASYPFNGNADDESGNGLNGTVVDAIPSVDRFGYENSAYGFDGNNGTERYIYANIGTYDTVAFSVWFKTPTPITMYPNIYQYGGTDVYVCGMYGNHTTYIGDGIMGKVSASAVFDNSVVTGINSEQYYDDDSWHHLVACYVPNDSLYVFIDNNKISSSYYF